MLLEFGGQRIVGGYVNLSESQSCSNRAVSPGRTGTFGASLAAHVEIPLKASMRLRGSQADAAHQCVWQLNLEPSWIEFPLRTGGQPHRLASEGSLFQ